MSEKKKHREMFYTYASVALAFFVLGLVIESVRIPFIMVSLTFAVLAFHRDQKVGEIDRAVESSD